MFPQKKVLDRRRGWPSYEKPQLPLLESEPAYQRVAPREIFDVERMSGRIYAREVAGAPTMFVGLTDGGGAHELVWPDRSILGPTG